MSEFESRLKAQLSVGGIHVDSLGGGDYRVVLPHHISPHRTMTFLLNQRSGEWVVSDHGSTAFTLGADFAEVASAIECASSARLDGDEFIARLREPDLAAGIWQFAATMASAELVRDALACSGGSSAKARAPKTSIVMAREARARIQAALGGRYEQILPVDEKVEGALDNVRAPLQLRLGKNRLPRLIVACVDLNASGQSVTAAKNSTAYLWAASHSLKVQRYTIAQGPADQVERLASVFDRSSQVTVVGAGDDRSLIESIQEELDEHGLVHS